MRSRSLDRKCRHRKACLRAITRRKESPYYEELAFGDLSLSEKDAKLVCEKNDENIRLAAKEYQMMELFLRNPGRILSRELIMDRVWGVDSEAENNSLEVYISFLRKKINFLKSDVVIKNTRGLGYSLEMAQ